MTKPILLSVRQAAEAVGVCPKTIRKWIATGRLESRVGDDGFVKIALSKLRKELSAEDYNAIKNELSK